MIDVELAVLGSGSGNAIVGKEWAGRRVAIIDDAPEFGGTCLNRGCIPTKMLAHPATVAAEVHDAARIDVHLGDPRIDWPAMRDRVFGRVDGQSASAEAWRAEQGVELVRETATFRDPHTLVTDSGTEIQARQVVIAAGSRPRIPTGIDASLVHTSDTIMRIDALPPSLLILGGGAVAAEMAHVFAAFGVDVTVAVRGDRMLGAEDELVADCYTDLATGRWRVLTGHEPVSVEADGDRRVTRFANGAAVKSALVLVAVGRIPNADRIGAQGLFDLTDDGRLVTDASLRVLSGGEPVHDVWALGDVTSPHRLKHVANHQARVVRANLRGEQLEDRLHPVPQAIFAGPEIASFGVRTQDAPVGSIVVTRDYDSTAYGWAMEDEASFVRLVVGREGRLLGAHILGPHASLLLQPLVQAASSGRTIHGLARSQYWPHPALSEVVENALLDAEKELT